MLLTTNYILNKILDKVTGKTTYELWKGNLSSYKYLKVWGWLAKVMVSSPKKVTVGPKIVDSSSDMHIMVVPIDLWYINLKYHIFMKLQ